DRHRHELALGDPVLQRTGRGVVEVVVTPAVALRPEDEILAVTDEAKRPRLDVAVRPLFDDRAHLAGRGIGDADVVALLVAAQAGEVNPVGRGAQPLRRNGGAGARTALAAAALTALPLPAAERARVLPFALGDRRR